MRLGIYGAGGMGKETLYLARYAQSITPQWYDIVFIDDYIKEKTVPDALVLRHEELLLNRDNIEVVIAMGEPKHRKDLYDRLKEEGVKFGKVIYPGSTMLPGAVVGEGCVLYGCELSTDVVVKENTLIDGHVIIGHDSIVGSHCFIGANTFVGGGAEIKNCVFVGPGSILKDRITIEEWSILGIGTAAHRSTSPEQIILGNPAQKIGINREHKVFGIMEE